MSFTVIAPTDDCDSGVYGIPETCVKWPCFGPIQKDDDGLYRCQACRASYGSDPVHDGQLPDA